jgi:DNA-binding response OmpR family regulator
MKILVVEDEAGVAGFVEQGLTEAGYAVNVARDGSEGLEYALAYEYDVIVLDIMLPKINGLDMLREIRKKRIKAPVLLLTARVALTLYLARAAERAQSRLKVSRMLFQRRTAHG